MRHSKIRSLGRTAISVFVLNELAVHSTSAISLNELAVRSTFRTSLTSFRLVLALILVCVATFPLLAQQNWPRFHGTNGSGLAEDAKLPTDWTDADYEWKKQLPGVGSSSSVIWGDRLFVTCCDPQSDLLTLLCLDANSGKEEWKQEFQQMPYHLHDRNSFASATPCVDAHHVYVSFADPQHTMLVALTHAGDKVWTRDFGTWVSQHGFGLSPQVYRDKVIFVNSQQAQQLRAGEKPGTSRVIAVYCKDGSDAWVALLKATKTCYSLPSVFTDDQGRDQLISCNTGNGFFSLDPESGEQNWEVLPFRQRTVASTLIAEGLVIGSNGSGGGGNYLVAIRPDQQSPTAEPEEAYTLQKSNYVPSPVAVNGMLFFFTDKGIGNCVDLQTGKPHWQQRLSSGFSGSPVATEEAIYVIDEEGKLFVIAASKEFQLFSKHDLGESTRSTPAIANNKIYFRTDSKLFCLGEK